MWCSTTRPRATTRGPRCPSGARQGWGRRLSSGVLHASAVSPQGRWLKRTLRTCAPLAPSAPPGSPGRSPHIPPLQRPGQPSVLHAGAGRAVLQLQVEPRGGTETGAGAGLSWPCPRAPLAAPTCNALLGCHACRLQHPTARPPPPPPFALPACSGCGNTFNCNHPVARQFIIDCLRYWVEEMHVDGFRWGVGRGAAVSGWVGGFRWRAGGSPQWGVHDLQQGGVCCSASAA